jgi:hypothetical protein
MVIENSLPQKQKALNAEPVRGLISIQEVTALCDRHHNHVVSAPVRSIRAGAFHFHYRRFAAGSQEGSHPHA